MRYLNCYISKESSITLADSIGTMDAESLNFINSFSPDTQSLYNNLDSAVTAIQALNDAKHNNMLRKVSQAVERTLCVKSINTFVVEFVGKLGIEVFSLMMLILGIRMRNIAKELRDIKLKE